MSSHVRAAARRWPLGAASTTLVVTTSLALGAGAALILHPPHSGGAVAAAGVQPVRPALRGDAVWKPGTRAAPGFSLRDQDGQQVSLSGLRGQVVLLAFMDSHCKLLCTFEGPTIHRIMGRLGAASHSVRLIVVSVNPWEDTASSSRRAGARWGFSGDWRWLRGSPGRLQSVWNGYGIGVKKAFGDVNHSSAIYLIDRRGYERAGFNYPFPAKTVARDLRKLAAPS
jgi:cytochrome oxidase Cu insertion factor (SCO1/SenC/PrrC family)